MFESTFVILKRVRIETKKKQPNNGQSKETKNILELKNAMAFVGVSQYNHHNQQIDEYEYDDTDNFYDDGANFGNYLDVDDSEGKCVGRQAYIKQKQQYNIPNKCFKE